MRPAHRDPPARAPAWLPWTLAAGACAAAVASAISARRARALHVHERGRLNALARRDGLTRTHNRLAGREVLLEAHAAARRDGTWLSLLMVDVDRFKRVNDTFGHTAGDDALVAVAARLLRAVRTDDLVIRWGGEEFLVVLPATAPDVAAAVAERLRASVAAEPIPVGTGGDAIHVTVSVGVASSAEAISEVLVHSADRAMYAAKRDGGDAVRTGAAPGDEPRRTRPVDDTAG